MKIYTRELKQVFLILDILINFNTNSIGYFFIEKKGFECGLKGSWYTALVKFRIIYLYQEGPHAVRNKADLDSGIKTKTSNLAL